MDNFAFSVILVGFVALLGFSLEIRMRTSRIERKLNRILAHLGIELLPDYHLSDRVKQIADDPARKIEAIKVYREETGAGLADAKNAVEAYMGGK
jgi:hypothetical protein